VYGGTARATVTAIIVGDELVESLAEGEEGAVVLDVTPFYAERGGQTGDTGTISADGLLFEVTDTQPVGGAVAHAGRLSSGTLGVGQTVTASVDEQRRDDIRRHHTATHLLHAALRGVLGEHVKQAGSLVAPDRLRFDFSHHQAISREELDRIEDQVNRWVLADLSVDVEHMEMEDALQGGAVALFGEKYGEQVRTVKVADASFELCGGTHCERTGAIGSVRILTESSVAAGTRRIEAVAGMASVHHSRAADALLGELSQALSCTVDEIEDRVRAQQERIRQLEKEVEAARRMSASVNVPDLVAGAEQVDRVALVAAVVPGVDREALKDLADEVVDRLGSGATVLGAEVDGKVALVAKVSEDLISLGAHAGNLVKAVAERAGGGGGGAPGFAQAGGGEPGKLPAAIEGAAAALADQLGAQEA